MGVGRWAAVVQLSIWLVYATTLVAAYFIYMNRHRRLQNRAAAKLAESIELGLTEPPSLHPEVDPAICVGSGACVDRCPEKALGIVGRSATLVNPSICIGHGACAASCPVDAITLVFGTERRGIDIPYVKPTFETNVRGIFIAGELGGMGLIGKSAEQGRQAMESIARNKKGDGDLDVVIVGAGPAGLAASLTAMHLDLKFILVEQEDSLGGTVYHYPRNKIAMTHPMILPIVGKVQLGEIRKESLLEFWQGVVDKTGLPIQFSERLEEITSNDSGHLVRTSKAQYVTQNVVLAIGRRGTPRKLGVPGEELPKVVYRLVDPEQYQGKDVLVVGGGDTALEAALALSAQADTTVSLSYRSDAFSRAKPKNRESVEEAGKAGTLQILLSSTVTTITADSVVLDLAGTPLTINNDIIIVCAGGILPTPMLKDIGVMVETKFGTA